MRGITQNTLKYEQRIFKATLAHLSESDYKCVERFFEDTDNGLKPFFLLHRPSSEPEDAAFLRLVGSRNAPYSGGALRNWGFEAEEVVGARNAR